MPPRHARNISPPGRQLTPPERASTGHLSYPTHDQYYDWSNKDSHTSPRSSIERVIPISSETYINGIPVSGSRTYPKYDQYGDYGRRSNLAGSNTLQRHGSLSSSSNRSRPDAIQTTNERSSSPISRPRHERDHYSSAIPANSTRREHKKIYSIDDGKPARLIGDREDNERDPRHDLRSHKTDGSSGTTNVDEHEGYEYTDARGMYRDTEPRWRPRRQGSVDTADRTRPTSMVGHTPHSIVRASDLPSTTKRLDKLHDGVARQISIRDYPRPVPSERGREHDQHSQDNTYDARQRIKGDRGETLQHERSNIYSPTRDHFENSREVKRASRKFEDQDVASRGFGIRATNIEPDTTYNKNYEHRIGHNNDMVSSALPRWNLPPDKLRLSPKSDVDPRFRDKYSEQERECSKDKSQRLVNRDVDREEGGCNDSKKSFSIEHDLSREHEDRYLEEERSVQDQRMDSYRKSERHERARGSRQIHHDEMLSTSANSVLTAGTGIAAAYGAQQLKDKYDKDRYGGSGNQDLKDRKASSYDSAEEDSGRERHYIRKDNYSHTDSRPATKREDVPDSIDPDEDYRRRIQKEVERNKQPKVNVQSSSGVDNGTLSTKKYQIARQTDEWREQDDLHDKAKGHESHDDYNSQAANERHERINSREDESKHSKTLSHIRECQERILDEPLTDGSAQVIENRENRVSIVEPPKEKEMPKGILRKPTEKFPEHPNTEREGVAPLKDATKKGIPAGARWTKIDRRLVNPEALEEAKERFEERQDCVIVLRVLTKEEIQNFADRTRDIRDERYDRDHKDRRHHPNKEKNRKDHDGAYNSYDEDEERDEPRQIGWH